MLNDNYWYQCPLCYQSYGANDEMSVYDEEYDEDICKGCKKELDAERELLARVEVSDVLGVR